MIHSLSDVKSKQIGSTTNVWQYCVILEGAIIGDGCNINCNTFIEDDVIIGNNVTIKSGVYLWNGLRIEDEVFIGPCATFINDIYPRSKKYIQHPLTILEIGSSIGANCTILGGLRIGRYSMIGAGSVVTKDVKPHALVIGNPGLQVGWVNKFGEVLSSSGNKYCDNQGIKYEIYNGNLIQLT